MLPLKGGDSNWLKTYLYTNSYFNTRFETPTTKVASPNSYGITGGILE